MFGLRRTDGMFRNYYSSTDSSVIAMHVFEHFFFFRLGGFFHPNYKNSFERV